MATLARQIPSPDSFLCQPWSSFVSAAQLSFVDNSSLDITDTEPARLNEALKLGKEDMLVRSQFPALEDFCLVVCHVCNQVVTPQGILKHYEKRHGSPVPSRGPLVPMKPKAPAVAPAVNPSPGDTLAFRVPKDYPHSRFNKAPLAVYPPKGARTKTCVSLPVVSLEKIPCLNRANSASHLRLNSSSSSSVHKPSSLTPPSSQRSGEKLLNGRSSGGTPTPRSTTTSPLSLDGRPSPARSPLDRRPSSTPSPSQLDRKPSPSPSPSQRCSSLPSSSSSSSSPLEKKKQNETKTSAPRSHKRLSGRVFDPNKHCGVPDPETKRPCTRSLTCKTHSLTQRRAVPGRRKHFDTLLAEHKGRPKEKEGAKDKEKERDVAAHGGKDSSNHSITSHEASPSKPHCPNGRPLSTLKLRLANAHIPRWDRHPTTSTSTPLPPVPTPASNPEPAAHGWMTPAGDGGRLSSDEGDTEPPEDADRAAFHFSNHHPQPLGLCIFSSRLMGRGHYVFDRRRDRIRLALQNMVEKHLNSQMWRKVPLAAESLQSPSGSSSISSQQPHPPSPLSGSSPITTSPSSSSNSYTATFPQTAGVFSIRDAPLSHTQTALGKAGNATHKSIRPSKAPEDFLVGSKRRKNSSFYSFTSLFPAVDNHKRNGNGHHPTLQGAGGTVATLARKKELGGGGGGQWCSEEGWMSRAEGSQSHNSQNSRDPGVSAPYTLTKDPATALHQPLASPSVPPTREGKPDSRKRRSPSSYRGKAKLSRTDGLESIFRKGSDRGGILASGPESPRQVKMHH